MRWPNLWILGPPKCGTSSLFRWLADHPEVVAAAEKEPFYLVDVDSPFRRPEANFHDHGMEGYGRYFPEPVSQTYRLDGTTHTLFQRSAVDVLGSDPNHPQAVVVVRKPSERVYSSFQFTRHVLAGIDNSLGFAEFRRLCEQGEHATLRSRAHIERSLWVLERDVEYSRYLRWLEPWHRALGNRLHVLVFEPLVANPQQGMLDLARRLGIDPGFYRGYDFARLNRTFRARSPRLHRWTRALRPLLPRNAATLGLYRFYLGLQRRRRGTTTRTPADLEALRAIDALLADDTARLADHFDLDLESWR